MALTKLVFAVAALHWLCAHGVRPMDAGSIDQPPPVAAAKLAADKPLAQKIQAADERHQEKVAQAHQHSILEEGGMSVPPSGNREESLLAGKQHENSKIPVSENEMKGDDPQAGDPAACAEWACTCEAAVKKYGVKPAVTWGTAPASAQEWWLKMDCSHVVTAAEYAKNAYAKKATERDKPKKEKGEDDDDEEHAMCMQCSKDKAVIWSWSGKGKKTCKEHHDGSVPAKERYRSSPECDVSLKDVKNFTDRQKIDCMMKCEGIFKNKGKIISQREKGSNAKTAQTASKKSLSKEERPEMEPEEAEERPDRIQERRIRESGDENGAFRSTLARPLATALFANVVGIAGYYATLI